MDLDELKAKLENKSEAVYPTGDYDKMERMAEPTDESSGLNIPVVSGSVLSDSEMEEYIWEEIELPLCETDRILNTDNYKRYLEAVKWAKFGRDERTDR